MNNIVSLVKFTVVFLPLMLLAVCTEDSKGVAPNNEGMAPNFVLTDHNLQVEKHIPSVGSPWGMALIPDSNQYLVSAHRGDRFLLLYENDELVKDFPYPQLDLLVSQCSANSTVARIEYLLDVILDPDFQTNRFIYVSFVLVVRVDSHKIVPRHAVIKLAYDPETMVLKDPSQDSLIFEECTRDDFPYPVTSLGGRFAFLPDKTLLFPIGPHHYTEIGSPEIYAEGFLKSQDKNYYAGKILRMTNEGEPVCGIEGIADNPFCGEPEVNADYVYTLGHKNSQGIAIDPNTGRIYSSEHGEQRGDEINLLVAGKNYGFPYICPGSCVPYYQAYPLPPSLSEKDFTPAWFFWDEPFYEDATVRSIAPSGIALYHTEGMYQTSLLVAELVHHSVDRIAINSDGSPSYQGTIAEGARFRQVKISKDGRFIYLLMESPEHYIIKLSFK